MRTTRVSKIAVALGILFAIFLSGCGLLNAGKPVAVIAAPPSGTQVDVNAEVQLQVNTTDDDGIVRVELIVNGTVVATEVSPQAAGQPVFNAVLRYTPKTSGAQVIEVRAYNRKGDSSAPVSINLQVRDAQALATGTPGIFPSLTPLTSPSATQTTAPSAPPPPGITVIVQPPPAATATRTRTSTPTRTVTIPSNVSPPTSHQVYGAIEVPAGATREVRAKCPSGELRTGGGFVTHSDMTIYTSQPIDANDWQAAAKNNSASTGVLQAYAICVANAPGSVVSRSAQTSIAPTKSGAPVATCPAGSFVTGGGHSVDPSLRAFWSRYSTSATVGWEVRAQNTGGSNQVLYSFVVCYTGAGGSIEVAKDGAIFASAINDVVVACPSPRIVTGGGFTLAGAQLTTRGSLINQNGWSVIASNTANYPLGVSSGAVCAVFQ